MESNDVESNECYYKYTDLYLPSIVLQPSLSLPPQAAKIVCSSTSDVEK